jgi:hypothetical protein
VNHLKFTIIKEADEGQTETRCHACIEQPVVRFVCNNSMESGVKRPYIYLMYSDEVSSVHQYEYPIEH